MGGSGVPIQVLASCADALAWQTARLARLVAREKDPNIKAMYEERFKRHDEAYQWINKTLADVPYRRPQF